MATPAAGATQHGASAWLLRRPRTWYLMLAFGLMNGGYASMIAWLAPHYQELGWSAAQSGTLVALLSIAQAAAALLLPVLAARAGQTAGPGYGSPWAARRWALRCWPWHLLPRHWPRPSCWAWAWAAASPSSCWWHWTICARRCISRRVERAHAGRRLSFPALPPWLMARLHQGGGGFSGGWWLQCAMALLVAMLVARLAPTQYERVMHPPA